MTLSFVGTPILDERDTDIKNNIDDYMESELALLQKGTGCHRKDMHYFINCIGVFDRTENMKHLPLASGTEIANVISQRMKHPVSVVDLIQSGELNERLSAVGDIILNKMYSTYEEINASIMYMTSFFCDIEECIQMSHIMKPGLCDREMNYAHICRSGADPRAFIIWTIDDEGHSDVVLSFRIDTDSFIMFCGTLPILGHAQLNELEKPGRLINIQVKYRKIHFKLGADCPMNHGVRKIEVAEMLATRYDARVVRQLVKSMNNRDIIINTDSLPPVSIN